MGKNIEFDMVDGFLKLEASKEDIIVTGTNERDNTYLLGKFPSKKLRDVAKILDSSYYTHCEEVENFEDEKYKALQDIIYVTYERGSEFYGFILLGLERKLVIELSPEDYEELKNFLSLF